MTLLQYVQSLQDQGATDIAAKVEEWKKKNQPKVEVEEVKEVKPSKFNKDGSLNVDSFSEETRGAAEKVNEKKTEAAPITGANVAATPVIAPDTASTLDNGSLVSSERKDLYDSKNWVYDYTVPGFKEKQQAEINEVFGVKVWSDPEDTTTYRELTNDLDVYAQQNGGQGLFNKIPDENGEIDFFRAGFGSASGYDSEAWKQVVDKGSALPGNNFALDYEGGKEGENLTFIDMISLRDQRIKSQTLKAREEFVVNEDEAYSDVKEKGIQFLSEKQNDFRLLLEKYKKAEGIEKENLKLQLDTIAKDENYGEELYDFELGKFVSIEKASTKSLNMLESAKKIAETTPKEDLDNQYVNSYYGIVGLAEDVSNYKTRNKKLNPQSGVFSATGGILTGEPSENDLELLKKIAETGIIPKNITKLKGKNPLIDAFNNQLEKHLVLNTAIQLNRNVLISDKEIGGMEMLDGAINVLGLEGLTQTSFSQNKLRVALADNLEESGFDVTSDEITTSLAKNFGQSFGGTFPALVEFAVQMYLKRKVTGNMVQKFSNKVGRFANSFKYLKESPKARLAFNFVNKGFTEGTEFVIVDYAFQNILQGNETDSLDTFKFGFALGGGGILYKGFSKFINKGVIGKSKILSMPDRFLDRYVPKTSKSLMDSFGSSFAGGLTYMGATIATDPFNPETYNDFGEHLILETAKMFALGKLTKGIPGLVEMKRNMESDILNMSNLSITSKKAAKDLNLSTEKLKKPTETTIDEINEAGEKAKRKLNLSLRRKEISPEEYKKRISEIEMSVRSANTQVEINLAKENIKLEEANGNRPSDFDIYKVTNKIKNNEELNAADSKILDNIPDGILMERLGVESDGVSKNSMKQFTVRNSYIQHLLNGGGLFVANDGIGAVTAVTPQGEFRATPQTMPKIYDFLVKKLQLEAEINSLKDNKKTNKSELEGIEIDKSIKEKEAEIKEYGKEGSKYEEIQKLIKETTEVEYDKKLKIAQDAELGGKGMVVDAKTPEEFQKIYDKQGFEKADVKNKIAFFGNDGKRIINREKALEVRDMDAVFHEEFHFIAKDAFKDTNGKVTKEGIKVIDGIIETLTPEQKKLLKSELDSRYNTDPNKKEDWYEEYLSVLSELISSKRITFKKSLGDKLIGMVPLLRKQGFKNLKINVNTGENLFEMIKGLAGSERNLVLPAVKEAIKGDKAIDVKGARFSNVKDAFTDSKIEAELGLKDSTKKIVAENDRIFNDILKENIRDEKGNLKPSLKLRNQLITNNLPRAAALAKQAANVGRELTLDAALKVESFQDFYSSYVEKLAKLGETYRAEIVVDKKGNKLKSPKQIPFGAYMNSILPLKYSGILESLKSKIELTTVSEEKLNNIEDSTTSSSKTEVVSDFKLVDNIKVNKKPLSLEFKDKVREFVTDKLKDLNVTDENFRSEAFKPSKEFINYIKQNLLGKSITDYKNFIRENPNFIKGLNIKALLEFDKGRTKEGKPRLFTELNRKLTKQKEIEKFIDQGRIPYLTATQISNGANLYNRLKPTETAIVNFLTGGSASTISNRKTALAREITNRFIKEATPSTEAFKEMTTAERAKVAEKLQVDPTAKFSNPKIVDQLKNIVEESAKKEIDSWKKQEPKKEKNETDESYKDRLETWNQQKPGALNLKTVEGRQKAVEIAMDLTPDGFFQKIFDTYGESARLILDNATWAPSGNKASTVTKRGQLFINNAKMAGAQVKDSNLRKKIIAESEALVNLGLVGEFGKVRDRLTELETEGNLKKQKGLENMKVATRSQGIKDIPNNIADRSKHIEGSKDLLRLAKEVYDKDPSTLPMLERLFYNSSANFAFYRKLAQIIDAEELAKGDKIKTEEHLYQAGNWAVRTLRAITSNREGNFEKWNKLQAENLYWQIAIGEKSQIIIDKTYSKSRFEVNGKFKDLPTVNFLSQEHPALKEGLDYFEKTGDISKVPDARIRSYNEYFTLNPFRLGKLGIKDAIDYNVMVPKKYWDNPSVISKAGKLIYEQIMTEIGAEGFSTTAKQARERMDSFLKVEPGKEAAMFSNSKIFGRKLKDAKTVEEQIEILKNYDTAAEMARRSDAPVKKIRVFDFDDTLARSKSKVLYELPDGKTGKLTATEYAKRSEELESKDAIFDFSEFNKVIDGKKGPLFELAKKIQDTRGSEDIFVLTARPQESATAIKEFLDALGLKLPIENITGLENGSPSAKANWIAGKAAKGYNDFYFADDMMKNVTAVKKVLDQIDVKGVVQQAKFSKEKVFDKIFNEIIESSTGIKTYKEFSAAKAKTIGSKKGRFTFFTTPSAEDFLGLLYKTLGKGKKGDAQLDFYKTNLIDPYNRAELGVTEAKITASRSFKALKSKLKTLPDSLSKQTGIGGFTFSQAARVSIWTKQGMEVPGLSKTDIKELNKFVDDNAELTTFTNELINIQKGKPYPAPSKEWLGGTITTDIIGEINKVNRKEYLQEWQENVGILFSDKNLNKLEAAYGSKYREALEESLYRMKTGSNRPTGGSRIVNEMMDWLNNSVGAIMFLNTRSAVLQTISSVNFINWENNNLLKAGKAFANQPQYWKDFKTLMNSPYLLERREGLKINVSESEIADAVMQSKNKVTGAINYLLNKGFVFTRIADSFAIASGGSTFYRNQIEAYMKAGRSKEDAEKQAYEDFYAIAETNQQSSNASKISQQQASAAGRVILAFGNTPMQYNRIIKKATQDLIAKRGDWKSNLTKIVYYAGMQNFIFNALQNALFAEAFSEDDDDSETTSKREARIADGMTDSLLRGVGIQGAALSAVKDALITIYKENNKEKGTPKYEKAIDDLLGFSPPISSKIRKVKGGLRTFSWNSKKMKEEGFNLNNPAYLASADIVEGFTNVPTGRAIKKINNIRNIFSDNSEAWQKVAMTMGWSSWDVGLPYYGVEDKVEMTPEMKIKETVTTMKKETNTKEQKQMLLDLGLSRQDIINLKYEDKRVQKILELQKSGGVKKVKTPESELKRQFDSIKDENKPDQVKTLLGFGLTKAQIRELKYEKDRVEKILELMKKKK